MKKYTKERKDNEDGGDGDDGGGSGEWRMRKGDEEGGSEETEIKTFEKENDKMKKNTKGRKDNKDGGDGDDGGGSGEWKMRKGDEEGGSEETEIITFEQKNEKMKKYTKIGKDNKDGGDGDDGGGTRKWKTRRDDEGRSVEEMGVLTFEENGKMKKYTKGGKGDENGGDNDDSDLGVMQMRRGDEGRKAEKMGMKIGIMNSYTGGEKSYEGDDDGDKDDDDVDKDDDGDKDDDDVDKGDDDGDKDDDDGDGFSEEELVTKGDEGGNLEKGVKKGMQTFEDLMEVVGTGGRWNIRIIIFCSFCSFTTPFSSMSYQFFGATPDHWCQVPQLIQANWTQHQIISLAIPFSNSTGKPERCVMYNYNYTAAALLGYNTTMADVEAVTMEEGVKVIHCPVRIYNTSQHKSTVVTEWDLTCERRPLYSTTQAATQIGMLIGSICYGYVLDAVGRRRGILISSVLSIIFGLLVIASPNVETFIALRLLYQLVEIGFYIGCLIIAMELCSPKQRTTVGALFLLPWTLGYMLVPGLAYFVRPWRWLQFAITLPILYTLVYFWVMPESPRWLILQGHYTKAVTLLKRIAAANRRPLPPDDVLLGAMEIIRDREINVDYERLSGTSKSVKGKVMGAVRMVFLLLLTPEVRVRAIVVFYLWAATSMVYYGVSLGSYTLTNNIYLYTFLGALFEIPAYLFLWLFISKIGRRKTLALLYLFCGISISLLAILLLLVEEASFGIKIFLSLTSKMAITAAFQLIWFYTTELFSTKYRARATAEACTFCRIGSALSPYINDLLGEVAVWSPSLVFSLAAFVAAGIVLILPETTNKSMPQKNQKI